MSDVRDEASNDGEESVPRPRGRRNRGRNATLPLSVSNRLPTITSLEEQLDALIEISIEATDADRATLFLNDAATGELYARGARGGELRDLRILNSTGIAGAVFTSGKGMIIADAYADSASPTPSIRSPATRRATWSRRRFARCAARCWASCNA